MKYLSDKSVALRYQIGRSTVWDWLSKGKLPQPVILNGSTRWKLSDLEDWEEGRPMKPRKYTKSEEKTL